VKHAEALANAASRLLVEARANPRFGALLLIALLILAIWLVLVTRDAIDAARDERAPLERRAARLELLAQEGGWEENIRAGEAQLEQSEALAWRAASADLAAADLQTALRAIIAQHMAWNRLKLAPTEDLPALGGWRIEAEINGKLRDEGVLPLLQAIAEHRPRVRVEQLQVANQRGQTITLQLSVLVLPEQTR
jgi:hypothetical protein